MEEERIFMLLHKLVNKIRLQQTQGLDRNSTEYFYLQGQEDMCSHLAIAIKREGLSKLLEKFDC